MRTPRPNSTTRRGFGTLIGNGWLHESPKNVWPKGWDIHGRSALRKCIFMPIPDGVKHLAPPQGNVLPARVSPAAMAPVSPASSPPKRNPAKDVRLFGALSPDDLVAARKR